MPNEDNNNKKKFQIKIIYSAINTYADFSATDKFLFMIKTNNEPCAFHIEIVNVKRFVLLFGIGYEREKKGAKLK